MTNDDPAPTIGDDLAAREPTRECRLLKQNGELRRENAALVAENDSLVEQIDSRTLEVAGHVLRIGDLELDLKLMRSEVDTLRVAVDSNRRIGAAVGILMSRLGVHEKEAFDVLKKASQATNTKLAAVASLVVESGETPSTTPSSGNSRC